MKRHSDSAVKHNIKTYPSNQDILMNEVQNLTYDVKFMKDLVKPLHEQNNKLKTTIHDLNFKVEDQFEKLMMNFSEEQQFKSRTSERDYTMGVIKEKMEEQIQTIDQLGEQYKISQKDYEFQQQLFNQKNEEFLNLKTQHECEYMKIINESENQLNDIKLVNQKLQLQIKDAEKKIQYQDNNIEKVIESRMFDKLKEMIQKSKWQMKKIYIKRMNASMKLQHEQEKKLLQEELDQQQYKIETKYKRAYKQNCLTEDQMVDLQKSNKSLKVEIVSQETQINQLKSQKMVIHQDLNKEKRERAMDNKQHKDNEQIINQYKENENRLNRLTKRLEDQTLKNQKEYDQKLYEKKIEIQEQIEYIRQQYDSICQIQESILNQKAGYEEQLMIQKIKFYKQLGVPIDETNLQFLTHDFEQDYDDPVNIVYISNLEKNQVTFQQKIQLLYDQIRQLNQDMTNLKEEQQTKYQLELENYKQKVQKEQQALNTQQEEAITQIFEQNNLKLQDLEDQHDYEIKQIQKSHQQLEQKLSEANLDIISKLKEIQEIKQDSIQRQYRLQQEIKQLEDKLEKQSSDYEKQKLFTFQENQKLTHNLQLQVEEKLTQITQLENQQHKLASQLQAKLHEIQELKQQIINYKKALELENQENKKLQDHIKTLQEKIRLLQLEVENSKIIYNIFRQKAQSTDIFEAHSIRCQQSEQKIRYTQQLIQINKSTAKQFHRGQTQKS
ncbi:hypothetical protein pb186bvf_004777 [Paramecium bursaria]